MASPPPLDSAADGRAAHARDLELYRLLVENAREFAILAVDCENCITSWNPGAERLMQWREAEMLGRSGAEIFIPEDREKGEVEKELGIARAEGRAANERWHLRRDGSRFWGSGIMHALYDDSGALVGFGKVMRDQTEQRRAEEERSRLIQALQEADQRKTEFLAILAHEMRTPLSALSNAAYVLESSAIDDPRLLRQVATIGRQARQLGRLAEDLLDVARIVQGSVELRPERLDLAVLLRDTVQGLLPLIEDRGHVLESEIPPGPLWIEADPVRLEQVFANLLNNAAKYTDPGGTLTLAAAREDGHAVVSVRDTGRGIDPEMLPRVFELFRQADPTGARSRGGLGIGLTLARRLVELHGGTITAHSEGLGRGAEFVVRLPLAS